ncbi:CaiB/BaiF CoA transferase family protein [Paraburkholderia phenoliruptrix]|uniref:CaiB/BaiF CoA transferase family protein n=1 Tax=Paraburkholderia phenoliruptrix TaxID=252970 RepID=UPI0028698469|nr:CaiB/BaiF CoA-transferase family protein [Paraburkholderia phenoliruptrix]WMY11031.1 CaiB/BaiF CoA-transferase family protein [Paraburkholderia phenoliruptrix]
MLPLQGLKVVTLEHAIAAPFCTRQLADLGARVIKIERPEGGDFARGYDTRVRGMSSHFVWTNRSKESLCLDLKDPNALPVLAALLSDADVLVQNLAPGAADRLGLSYDVLSAKHPRLIVCGISGYGPDGSYRDKKAYDLLIQSESGFLSVTGSKDESAKAGCSVADIAAGMYAFTAILASLLERQKTGKGTRIDISMLESMIEWMSFPLYYAFEDQTPPSRCGAAHATIFPYGPFRTGDNKQVMLGIQNEREWKAFCELVLQDANLAVDERFNNNPKRVSDREKLGDMIHAVFDSLAAEQITGRLDKAGIANASVNDMHDVWNHVQLKERDRWRHVQTPVGPVRALLPPFTASGAEARMDPVPSLGQHTSSILAELGFRADLSAVSKAS